MHFGKYKEEAENKTKTKIKKKKILKIATIKKAAKQLQYRQA